MTNVTQRRQMYLRVATKMQKQSLRILDKRGLKAKGQAIKLAKSASKQIPGSLKEIEIEVDARKHPKFNSETGKFAIAIAKKLKKPLTRKFIEEVFRARAALVQHQFSTEIRNVERPGRLLQPNEASLAMKPVWYLSISERSTLSKIFYAITGGAASDQEFEVSEAMPFELLISGGSIHDGTGFSSIAIIAIPHKLNIIDFDKFVASQKRLLDRGVPVLIIGRDGEFELYWDGRN